MTLYGLKKCSTCQKAEAALSDAGWEVRFHDVRDEPLSRDQITDMLAVYGDKLVNRASLTWRGMSEAERATDPVDQLVEKPALMKRPTIAADDLHLLGWTANVKRALGVPA
ncbi:arsenate reductase family protein [Paracoccus sp. (in: a-proteobacteria)]|uniref:arsenate reductase family protein n=1 Tax=Paracoccus sp. TaxID=267 RepID=UPI0026E0C82C|nr:ArsC/Spx/MgsR family protein [Paracoccus sp. (in: a-proteobacteria)]